jgi:hypothetical protein
MTDVSFKAFLESFAVNHPIEVITTRGKVTGKFQRIDENFNIYLLNDAGHAFVQFKYVVGLQILEEARQ